MSSHKVSGAIAYQEGQRSNQVRRWRAFAVLAVSFFMTVADLAIVNVALPTIGRKLHMPESSLQWVVTGYALTFGIHSRVDETIRFAAARIRAGNIYVNRNMIGAVVGVQPFGGHGLSGTGPKAGGPHYLPRFATEQTVTINTAAAGGNAALMSGEE